MSLNRSCSLLVHRVLSPRKASECIPPSPPPLGTAVPGRRTSKVTLASAHSDPGALRDLCFKLTVHFLLCEVGVIHVFAALGMGVWCDAMEPSLCPWGVVEGGNGTWRG